MTFKWTKSLALLGSLVVLNVAGSGLLAKQASDSLQAYSQERTQFISDVVKSMVSEILYVYYQELDGYTGHCDKFLQRAKMTLLTMPYVRSVNISDEQFIYCSTTLDKKRISITNFPLSKDRMSLIYVEQSPLNKKADSIVLDLHTADGKHVLFGMHPNLLRALLGTEMNFFTPYLVLNHYVLTRYRAPYYSKSPIVRVANSYVEAGYTLDRENYINYFLVNYSTSYITLLLSSVFFGILLYMFLNTYDFLRIGLFFALKRQQFVPYYQPIIDRQGRLHGVEVLARWIHPCKGMISPAIFIPSAEKSGQINHIFTMLVEQVVRDLKGKQNRLPSAFHLALNVSAPQLLSSKLDQDCRHLLYAFNKSHVNVVLELTERVEIPDSEQYTSIISKLKSLGIKIALDDFGTGHSSLRSIKALKIDLLKVDKSFIDMISEDYSEDHIVANVLDLAKRIQIPVVAEGIESEFQRDYLLAHQVDYFQGFYFSKPLPFDQFSARYL
jgi:c-di-GMP phosphodiesterase